MLRSDFLTQGPAGPRFEQAVAAYCGAAHGVAVSSATARFTLPASRSSVGPGDVCGRARSPSSRAANCALYCGADVDFVDIDPRTYNMSVETARREAGAAAAADACRRSSSRSTSPASPATWRRLRSSPGRYGFRIIEDASHAIGAAIRRAGRQAAATATSPSSASTRSRSSPPAKAAWR